MRRFVLVLLVVGMLAGIVLYARHRHAPASSALPAPLVVTRPPYDPLAIQKTVEFHARKLRDNPRSAMEANFLAGSYLQRGRETGDIKDALLAEQAARRSLAIRSRRNAAAHDTLALSLLTQHRFSEAWSMAGRALASAPDDAQSAYLRAECLLEQGDYAQAEKALQIASGKDDNPNANTLRARLLILKGDPQNALTYLVRAQSQADKNIDMPVANLAWYHMRRGDCLAGMGRAQEAEQAYHEALTLFPRDYRTLTALCRLAAGRNDWPNAIAWGQKAADIVPAPDTLALLYDAYQATGNANEARNQLQLIETIAHLTQAQGSVYDRQRALFYADHDLHLPQSLTLAQGEMKVRHDIYAYDTLAWACFKNGRLDEAQTAMMRALALHTQDASLFFHAGMIANARGDKASAKTNLQRALAINPYFHPTGPSQARRVLARLP